MTATSPGPVTTSRSTIASVNSSFPHACSPVGSPSPALARHSRTQAQPLSHALAVADMGSSTSPRNGNAPDERTPLLNANNTTQALCCDSDPDSRYSALGSEGGCSPDSVQPSKSATAAVRFVVETESETESETGTENESDVNELRYFRHQRRRQHAYTKSPRNIERRTTKLLRFMLPEHQEDLEFGTDELDDEAAEPSGCFADGWLSRELSLYSTTEKRMLGCVWLMAMLCMMAGVYYWRQME